MGKNYKDVKEKIFEIRQIILKVFLFLISVVKSKNMIYYKLRKGKHISEEKLRSRIKKYCKISISETNKKCSK